MSAGFQPSTLKEHRASRYSYYSRVAAAAVPLPCRCRAATIAVPLPQPCNLPTTARLNPTSQGNDYRGEFRGLAYAWAGEGMCLSKIEYQGDEASTMHLRACAFLDACAHGTLWWQDHGRRPFFAAGVGSYHVNSTDRSSNRVLWSTSTAPSEGGEGGEGSDPGGYRVYDGSGSCLVHAEGGASGYFEVGWLEERRTRRHTYQLDWVARTVASSSGGAAQRAQAQQAPHPQAVLVISASMNHSGRAAGGVNLGSTELASVAAGTAAGPAPLLVLALASQAAALPSLLGALSLVQSCASRPPTSGVWLLTRHTASVRPAELVSPNQSGLWGLARSARSEVPQLSVRCADVAFDDVAFDDVRGPRRGPSKAASLALLLAAGAAGASAEPEVAMRGEGVVHVLRLIVARQQRRPAVASSTSSEAPPSTSAEAPPPSAAASSAAASSAAASSADATSSSVATAAEEVVVAPSTHLLTGGTGGLGLVTACWLAEVRSHASLVLASRSGALPAEAATKLRVSGE